MTDNYVIDEPGTLVLPWKPREKGVELNLVNMINEAIDAKLKPIIERLDALERRESLLPKGLIEDQD